MKNIYHTFIIMTWWKKYIILFLIFFPLRFLFGIFSEFWFDDEVQIYLIGLKFYTGGHWPYFGPDVVYTGSQIPGALQGILVGIPFYFIQIPEAPCLLLNLLTFSSLFLLGHYIIRYRTPGIPEWFLWIWIFTAPWVMSFSTHTINPSYVLPAAILFFISLMEIIPGTCRNFISSRTAFLILGFCILWIFQLHLSWILLMPLLLLAFYHELKKGRKNIIFSSSYFIAGCVLGGIFLIPTFITYGLLAGSGDTASNIAFNSANIREIITVFVRLLSFGSFELARFMGANTAERFEFAMQSLWAVPFVVIVGLIGFAQVGWMIIAWFRKNELPGWKTIKQLLLFVFLITYTSFFFSVKDPASHTFYLMFPLVMIYSFYCWQPLFRKKWIRRIAIIFLFSGIIFHTALALDNFKNKSMYSHREKPLKAIQQKDYKILGERRVFDRNE
ncbi:MAG: hypothetical protein V1904_04040 [Bacteroidota bacterium]